MKLWIYGDSFATDWKVDWGWQRLLAPRLKTSHCYIQACAGTSNEWILKTFRDDAHEPGDCVIVFLTEPARQWFFEDEPHLSNLVSILNTADAADVKEASREKYDAVIGYYEHLHRDDLSDLRLQMITDFLRVKGIERQINLQVIPAFTMNIDWTDLYPCKGNMTWSICDREFADCRDIEQWYGQSIDTRANHMTAHNHRVFADLLLERFTKPGAGLLDLEHERFQTGFLKLEHKLTHPGLCEQLVQMAMQPGNTIPPQHWPKNNTQD